MLIFKTIIYVLLGIIIAGSFVVLVDELFVQRKNKSKSNIIAASIILTISVAVLIYVILIKEVRVVGCITYLE